jgi:uncharacterized membrane protein
MSSIPRGALAAHTSSRPRSRRWPIVALMALGSLAVLSAIARLVSIADGLSMEHLPDDHVDKHYIENLAVVLAHLVPGIAFMVLGPLQLSEKIRAKWPRWHRWAGRVYVVSGIGVALTSLYMNEYFPPIGGALKYSANLFFAAGLIVSLAIAVIAILKKKVALHRAWMIRGLAMGLGVATQRIYLLPIYIAYGGIDDLTIGIGVWAGFAGNLAVAELVLWRGRRAAKRVAALRSP